VIAAGPGVLDQVAYLQLAKDALRDLPGRLLHFYQRRGVEAV
jgi:hypothetical protein